MNPSDIIDLCSDDEIGESNAGNGQRELGLGSGGPKIKGKSNGHLTRRESEENICSSGLSTGYNRDGSPVDDSSHSSAPPVCSPPICRQFWKAGNFEIGQGKVVRAANQNGKNNLRVHPMFLHSNATSHKWAFGAIAELLDNAVDEIQNGATFVNIDKISNPRDGSPALLIQDDGGGMDPEAIRRCMSFGFSDKNSKSAIGQYGNGFKTSSMRLGADVVVFSCHMKKRTLTQSVGLLSYTFLRQMGHDRIVVPMVDYEFNSSTKTFGPILPHGKEHFSSNLSTLLQWSPYSTEAELLKQFDDVGHHGTKIVIYNLWLNDNGNMELDFESDAEDIRVSGDPKLSQAGDLMKPKFDQHIANLYQYSLHVYSSILYLRLPQSFKIILRGRVVEHRNIVNDLKYPEFILYRPHVVGTVEAAVITTIGFLKEAPKVNIHGFNIYHRNRLILPFWRALKNTTNNIGRGIVGVLEANYIEPTHNKQDFEKTSLFQKLEDRLKQMTLEYWDYHCELLGYQHVKRTPPKALPYEESLSSRTHNSLAPKVTASHATARRLEESADMHQTRSKQRLNVKRKEHSSPVEVGHTKRHTGYEAHAIDNMCGSEGQLDNGIEKQLQDQETTSLVQENKKLRSQQLELEKNKEKLKLKVQQLRSELEDVQREYTKLLAASKSMDMIEEEKNVNG